MNAQIPWKDVETVNIDFDHTITQVTTDEYLPPHKQSPNQEVVDKLWESYYAGKTVIIWTARPWSDAAELAGVLTMWEVPFHGLMMAKGGSDKYIDDKSIRPDEFVNAPIEERDDQRFE